MQKREFEEALNELRRASTRAAAVCAWDALRNVTGEPWFDATHAERLRHACEDRGLTISELRLPSLDVGEAWVLLYDAGMRNGRVTRLRAKDKRAVLIDNGILHELERAQAGLSAVLARSGRLLPRGLGPRSFELDEAGVFGDSLGLSACIALMSRALDCAPVADMAASAEVKPDGSLAPVSHLIEKLEALQLARPEVKRVLVAKEQPGIAANGQLELIPIEGVEEAFRLIGLETRELAQIDEHALIRQLNDFALQEEQEQSTEAWLASAMHARATAQVLRDHLQDEPRAAECFRWAALFALHGGDPALAEDLVRYVGTQEQDAELRAWKANIGAAARIDTCPHEAVALAEEAVRFCDTVEKERTRRLLRARALGTHGRALMHAGLLQAADGPLRESLGLHRDVAPREVPRSLSYLAQCLRLRGRSQEALAECERGLALTRKRDQTYDRKSALFLELERGRALLALGQHTEASKSFEAVAGAQVHDHDYPRLAALRGLAAVNRALGRHEQAREYLERCVRVARSSAGPLREVAAMAVAEGLLAVPAVDTEELWVLWTGWYGHNDRDLVSARVRAAVY